MRQHTYSAARLLMPLAAIACVVGLTACGSDDRPVVSKTVTSRTTTSPGYVIPAPGTTTVTPAPVTTGTTTTQTTVSPVPQ